MGESTISELNDRAFSSPEAAVLFPYLFDRYYQVDNVGVNIPGWAWGFIFVEKLSKNMRAA